MKISTSQALLFCLIAKVLGQEDGEEFDCEGNPSDVVFLLDSSNSIWGPDFELQLRFISHVVRRFRIGPDHMKVAVVTYSDRPVEQFKLLEHKHRIRDAIVAINHDGGVYTHTGDAIHMVRTKTLAVENGGRDNVTKILIMITDGRSYNATATAIEAAIARSEGLHMFVIGVGDRYDVDELYALASQPYGEYIFRARSYRALDRLKDLLAVQACTVTDPPTTMPPPTTPLTTTAPMTTTETIFTTTSRLLKVLSAPTTSIPSKLDDLQESHRSHRLRPPPHGAYLHHGGPYLEYRLPSGGHRDLEGSGMDYYDPEGRDNQVPYPLPQDQQIDEQMDLPCSPVEPTDLVFVVDEKQGGKTHSNAIWRLIRDVIRDLDLEDDRVKVDFVQDCPVFSGMRLGQHKDKMSLLDALEGLPHRGRVTSRLLRDMTSSMLSPADNALEGGRRKVAVYITDGTSGDLRDTLQAAQDAKLRHGVRLFGVGLGPEVDPTEMKALVSCHSQEHLFLVPDEEGLGHIRQRLAFGICTKGDRER